MLVSILHELVASSTGSPPLIALKHRQKRTELEPSEPKFAVRCGTTTRMRTHILRLNDTGRKSNI